MLFWKRVEQLEREIEIMDAKVNAQSNAIKGLHELVKELKTKPVATQEKDVSDAFKNKDGLYDYRAYRDRNIDREDD